MPFPSLFGQKDPAVTADAAAANAGAAVNGLDTTPDQLGEGLLSGTDTRRRFRAGGCTPLARNICIAVSLAAGAASIVTIGCWFGKVGVFAPSGGGDHPQPAGSPFQVVGQGVNLNTSNGEVAQPYTNLGVVNVNDTLGYAYNVSGVLTPGEGDPSQQNCSLIAGGQVLVFDQDNLVDVLPVTGIASAAAMNASLDGISTVCFGNTTFKTTVEAFNGGTAAEEQPRAIQVNYQGPVPPVPPAPVFGLVGQAASTSSTDGEVKNFLSDVGAVNGDDAAGYSLGIQGLFTGGEGDPTQQNCTVNAGGQSMTFTPAAPQGTLVVTGIQTEAALNTTLALADSVCYGNSTFTTQTQASNGQVQSAVLPATQENYSPPVPPAPPAPPAPAFDLTGQGATAQTSNGQTAALYSGVGEVNGNNTLAYGLAFDGGITGTDSSTQNCSMSAGGQTVVLTPAAPNATLIVPAAAIPDGAAVNATLANAGFTCFGNATLNVNAQAANGVTLSSIVNATQVNVEAPPAPPAGPCVDGNFVNVPQGFILAPGASGTISGVGFNIISGDPSTAMNLVCNFAAVMGCPPSWSGSASNCQSPPATAGNLADVVNGQPITNANVGRIGTQSISCYPTQPAASQCPPGSSFVLATVTGTRLAAQAEPVLAA